MASHSSKTKHKNAKKHRRGGRNIFWLVRSTRTNELLLFSRKPVVEKAPEKWKDCYKNEVYWSSSYSEYYPNNQVGERIRVDHIIPIPVKLIICNDNPDMYIQRCKDCLFICSRLETCYIGGNRDRKVTRVPHSQRISNRLFLDVTEESGIVGIKIIKI